MKFMTTNETWIQFLRKSTPHILGLGAELCFATIESMLQKDKC